jgi:hypothetical protein
MELIFQWEGTISIQINKLLFKKNKTTQPKKAQK